MAEAKKVTRIKATDDTSKKAVKASKATAAPKAKKTNKKNAISAYFKGAWVELKQVRWPNRRATWALTIAVIVFSLFFLGFIVLLDLLFKSLFELVIA